MFCFCFHENENKLQFCVHFSRTFFAVKNTHTFYSLPLYPNNCCNYLCPMSRLSQISLNAKIRNIYAKSLSVMPTKSVAKCLFDSVLAKNQIFLNETDWRRLEIKLQGK